MMERRGKFVLLDKAEFATCLADIALHRQIRMIQNHHSFLPAYEHFNGSNHFDKLLSMEAMHLERGFSEIAQNLTTFPDGWIALCRPLDKIPAGAKGANTAGISIEHLGNFDQSRDQMTPAQRETVVQVNALLCRKLSLTPSTDSIVYHHWFDLETGARLNGQGSTKSCPGTAFFGGNSLAAARTHFIPLIQSALDAMSEPIQPLPAQIFEGRVISDTPLNVRMQPRAWSKKIAHLYKGVVVSVYATHGSWCRIHPRQMRWVNGKYLERT